MKVWTKILAAFLVLGLVSFAGAAKAGKGKKGDHAGVKGKITSIDTTAKTITVSQGKKKAGGDVTVSIDTSTKIEVDGVSGKALSDLQSGERVVVTRSGTGPATEIQATSAHKGKGKVGGKKKNK